MTVAVMGMGVMRIGNMCMGMQRRLVAVQMAVHAALPGRQTVAQIAL